MNWKRKFSSRKFWALIVSFIASILMAFSFTESEITQITAVITAFGSVAVYTLAESSVDKKAIEKEKEKQEE